MTQTRSTPLVSVIIRTFNSWSTTREIIALLDDPRIERILVDSGSSDLPSDIGLLVENVIHYQQKPFSYGGSLNIGVLAAQAEWTWILSSHCIPIQSEVVSQIIDLLPTIPPEVVCVLGATLPLGKQQKVSLEKPTYSPLTGFNFPGGNPNCLYRTAKLRARPFDERLLTCEDIEWFIAAKRSGALLAASSSFPVLYRTQRSASVMYRKGLNEYRVGKCLGKPRSRIGFSLIKRLARNFTKVLLRRLSWGDFLRKESYIFGWFCAENFLPPFTDAEIRRPHNTSIPQASTDLPAARSAISA